MSATRLAAELLTRERFVRNYANAAGARVATDLLGSTGEAEPVEWSYLISCASVLALADDEAALEAALRIAQTALLAPDAADVHRNAAVLLLDRAGNRPSLDLARTRGHIGAEDLGHYPAPLRMEIVRNRLDLAVPGDDGRSEPVNRFQRDLWTAVEQSDWVSASAPTSAGKSLIVRRWFRHLVDRALRAPADVPTTLVALVPTRALVDEVSRALTGELPDGVPVHSLPWVEGAASSSVQVFVLTQERMHLLQQRSPGLTTDLVFIDEAHKLGDGARGVLLHQVLDEAVRRNPHGQVVFASPLAADPESLLDAAPSGARTSTVDSQAVTVTQNLLYANQVPRRTTSWVLDLVLRSGVQRIGDFALDARPSPDGKRLPLVAVALGRDNGGNLVYADGAAAAEKMAGLIFEALGPTADRSSDPDVAALIELVEQTVNPRYGLARVLGRGVAFHYGNMPQLVRSSIEDLFRKGGVSFLVCTSTLLEGVNLPCRSIFVRGPHRGRGKIMSPADFWNLAGRAGRWGLEFEGNIVCVDTNDAARWPDPPRARVRQRLRRETTSVLAAPAALLEYIAAGTPPSPARRELEAVYSFLAARVASGVAVEELPGLALDPVRAAAITESVRSSLVSVTVPPAVIARHAGISPLSMQRLLSRMADEDAERLLPGLPEEPDAWRSYAAVFRRLVDATGADLGVPARQRQLAVLVLGWMRGLPLARLIADRLSYQSSLPKPAPVAATIRGVMDDVENVARFLAPKYLACYLDLLRMHLARVGRLDLTDDLPTDIEMLLELGVSTATELSLLTLGLSRTSAVELFALIIDDGLTPTGALAWLAAQDLDRLDVPELVRREAAAVLAAARRS